MKGDRIGCCAVCYDMTTTHVNISGPALQIFSTIMVQKWQRQSWLKNTVRVGFQCFSSISQELGHRISWIFVFEKSSVPLKNSRKPNVRRNLFFWFLVVRRPQFCTLSFLTLFGQSYTWKLWRNFYNVSWFGLTTTSSDQLLYQSLPLLYGFVFFVIFKAMK